MKRLFFNRTLYRSRGFFLGKRVCSSTRHYRKATSPTRR